MAVNISANNAKRQSSTWSRTVIEEVSVLDIYISDAVSNGNVEVQVGATTSITIANTTVTGTNITADNVTGQSYYNVWQNTLTDQAKQADMEAVIKHFEDLGYSISRRANSAGTLLTWFITWY